jgi:hypothetical protein
MMPYPGPTDAGTIFHRIPPSPSSTP